MLRLNIELLNRNCTGEIDGGVLTRYEILLIFSDGWAEFKVVCSFKGYLRKESFSSKCDQCMH